MTEFNFDTVFDETMQTHNLDTVVILGHLNPDGDAAGSVMSLAHYIHVNYPQYRVFPYLAKTLERGPKKMVVEDKIFVPFEMPDISGKQYCVIVCDNATLVCPCQSSGIMQDAKVNIICGIGVRFFLGCI